MNIQRAELLGQVRDYLWITFALVVYAFAWTFFLLPYEIVTGGVTGFAAIVFYATHIQVSYTYFIINAALLIVALKILGWKFLVKTIYAIIALTFLLSLAEYLTPKDELGNMVKILGEGNDFMSLIIACILNGAALALVFEHDGSTGGVDIIAACVNKYKNMSLGTVMMLVDLLIVSSSYLVFQDYTKIIFGLCTIIVETVTLDYVLNSRRQSVQFFIFSKKHEELAKAIATEIDTGVTFLDGHGWYSGQEIKVICTLTRRRNSARVFRIIKAIDPNAFVSQSSVIGVYGEGFDVIKT